MAAIIADPRTLNRKVLAYSDLRTAHELYDTVERISGEKVERKYVSSAALLLSVSNRIADLTCVQRSVEDIDAGIAETKDDPMKMFDYYQYTYMKSYDVMSENTPEYARYLGYLIGKDLYPGIKGRPFEDFVKEALETGLEPMYEEHADWIRSTSSFVFKGVAST